MGTEKILSMIGMLAAAGLLYSTKTLTQQIRDLIAVSAELTGKQRMTLVALGMWLLQGNDPDGQHLPGGPAT